MTDKTAEVKLYDAERLHKLTYILDDCPDDIQSVIDLSMMVLILAEMRGIEKEDMLSAIEEQSKIASKMAVYMLAKLNEEG